VNGAFAYLPLEVLTPASCSIRVECDVEKFADLVESVKAVGVLEPLIVRPTCDGKYEIVCGLRRFMTAKKAGLKTVPCVILPMSDNNAFEAMLVENLQRKDLTDYEVGRWLKFLLERYPEAYSSQEVLANKIGKTHQYISYLIKHFEEIEKQKALLSPDLATRVAALPESIGREIRKAPEEVKPKIYEYAVKHDVSTREVASLVEVLKKADEKTRGKAAKLLIDEGLAPQEAQTLVEVLTTPSNEEMKETKEKPQKSLFDRLLADYPEKLLKAIFESLGDNVPEDEMRAYIKNVIALCWDRIADEPALMCTLLAKAKCACEKQAS